ncbi:MAG: hypothetical protein FP814_15495 [Desulfobacterium sp.]|nr:hypothetical protein [Desulfobacterium sp.]MBU3947217.1 hypothetical protein [Pseudomonadota bacterium]MBU4010966.1 hypothetical protein [Pseudomonadota bacterium]
MEKQKKIIQLIWAIALILMGIGVFYQIPYKMQQLEHIKQFSSEKYFIRFCFYLLGFLLIGGGLKKIYKYYGKSHGKDPDS